MPPRPNTAQADLDDDDIVVLNEAPVHMRPKPRAAPILVLSSDEDEPGPSAPRGSGRGKRTRSGSSPILLERMPQRKRKTPRVQTGDSAHSSPVNAEAGPSNQQAPDSDPQAPIVPKADYLVDLVVDIIPDICPDWVKTNLTQQIAVLAATSNVPGQDAVGIVVDMAFAMGDYPKAGEAAAKAAPQDREAEDSQYTDPNYRKDKRTGLSYRSQALEVLESHFLMIPVGFIRQTFQTGGSFQLIPTYLILSRQQDGGPGLFAPLKKGRTETKGKNRALPDEEEWFNDPIVVQGGPNYHDPSGYVELRREKKQMLALISKEKETKAAEAAAAKAAEEKEAASAKAKEEAILSGNAAECGCCFDMEPLSEMVSCAEGHLFCKTCVKSLAESKLGEQLTVISCMDMSGCANLFTERILAEVLSTKTLELYHRLKQHKDLEMAEIDGLESCPFCPYAVVIDNEAEKLFHCLNTTCMKVTCRKCKRDNHIPKRCEEVEADLKLNKRHAVEEAMSEALMRKCPKCSKPYVKEHGCNKIMCHSCQTMSCYICQKAIPEGYAHFDQAPGRPAAERKAGKCPLWDQNEAQSEAQRIRQARDTAQQNILERAAQEGVELSADDLRVDAPEAAAAAARPAPGVYAVMPAGLPARRAIQNARAALAQHNPANVAPNQAAVEPGLRFLDGLGRVVAGGAEPLPGAAALRRAMHARPRPILLPPARPIPPVAHPVPPVARPIPPLPPLPDFAAQFQADLDELRRGLVHPLPLPLAPLNPPRGYPQFPPPLPYMNPAQPFAPAPQANLDMNPIAIPNPVRFPPPHLPGEIAAAIPPPPPIPPLPYPGYHPALDALREHLRNQQEQLYLPQFYPPP